MEPTFKQGDYVIVNKLVYTFTKPAKNDVIVFKHPKEKNRFLIKRISMIANSNEIFSFTAIVLALLSCKSSSWIGTRF